MPDSEVEFRILGPLELVRSGSPQALATGHQRTLLAALLVHANEVVATERLLDVLWGEDVPKTARAALQGYVAQLRRALPPDRLLTREAVGYVLVVRARELDAARFESLVDAAGAQEPAEAVGLLREALSLWSGPALLDVRDEPFAQREITRLEELRLSAFEQRIDANLALGGHRQVVPELEALHAEHPLREGLATQLMLALYRSGRQADALQAYQRCRRALVEELGIEPGPALRDLERRILQQDPGLLLAQAHPETEQPADERPGKSAPAVVDEARPDELRTVTILFADVVGSTSLAERLEPAEQKALVGECVTMMSRAVEEYGGTVQAYQGDGICAYFGVPVAHEDDHERAARAALRILEVIGEYAKDIVDAWGVEDFDVRIGINSGRAAVGVVGAADPQEVALGDATNVAARLESLAAPGTIAVGPETARRLTARFELEAVGEVAVKGREKTVDVHRLIGAKAREARDELAFLVGRDAEVAQLAQAVDELAGGRGRVLLVTGEPGIGKTRLLSELRLLAGERVTWLEGRCLSYGGPATWPFKEAVLGWLGAEIGEPEIAVRTKTRARLGALPGDGAEAALPAFARLLRLRLDSGTGDEEVAPGIESWLRALAAERPVILALEDVHWADGSTRELAELVLALTDELPLGVVLTQEPSPGSEGAALRLRVLGDFAHRATELSLGPLSEEASEQLLAALLGDAEEASRSRLVREAEGNPLYLEELARSLLEGALRPQGRTWTITVRSSELLPPVLENLLVARIDRLPEAARRVVHLASVIGRDFPVRVLEVVAGGDVGLELAELFRGSVVRELRRYPELECTFSHGLLHEAALSTLTAQRRRELSAHVAAAYESLYAELLDDHLYRLAHYHAQAGNLPQALEYAERARRAGA